MVRPEAFPLLLFLSDTGVRLGEGTALRWVDVDPNESCGLMDPHNFRERVFRRVVQKVLGKGRRFTPHGRRHTFASLHLAHGTNLKWVQARGGWASAKVLLDVYGHFLPSESSGFADALSGAPGRPPGGPSRQGCGRRCEA